MRYKLHYSLLGAIGKRIALPHSDVGLSHIPSLDPEAQISGIALIFPFRGYMVGFPWKEGDHIGAPPHRQHHVAARDRSASRGVLE